MGAEEHRPHALPPSEDGAAAVEVALSLPFVVLALVLIAHVGILGADVVSAQGVAREAARVAAVADDAAVAAAAQRAGGGRVIEVELSPADSDRNPGEQVTATVTLRSRAFSAFGARVRIPARATMRIER